MTTERELEVGGEALVPESGWTLTWEDRVHGRAVMRRGHQVEGVLVEGGPSSWVVTVRGRRIEVTARSHRERLLAATAEQSRRRHGSAEVRATLPGLVVRVAVEVGDDVTEGSSLVTVEAMKMQNEIRAPRSGWVSAVEVAEGQTIASGAVLVRLADLDP
jgi:biotin carboxyl carrier protein